MEFLVLTWDDIVNFSIIIARKIVSSGFRPDIVVGILRGGYVVAKLIGDLLGINEIGSIEVKFYKGIGERSERPIITQPLIHDVRDRIVLVADDVADSGRTLQVASEVVKLHGAKEVKTATLYFKPRSIFIPDFYAAITSKWIVFPWEYAEVLREVTLKNYGKLSNESLSRAAKDIGLEKIKFMNQIVELIAEEETNRP